MQVISTLGKGRAAVEDRPSPEVEAGELLLELRCCGLCGTDLFKLRFDTVPPGTVLGHEIVGVVAEAGGDFELGDRVVVPHHVACGRCSYCRRGNETLCRSFRENVLEPGGFAELVRVHRRGLLAARRLPDDVTDDAAAFLEPAACVLRAVERSGLQPTEPSSVAILGAGSMGLLHLLILRALGGEAAVSMLDPLADRRRIAAELGATAALDPLSGDVAHQVLEQTGGEGVDVVFDTVGGAPALELACKLTREGGSVVLFAHAGEKEGAELELNRLFKYERRILGSYSGSLNEQERVFQLLLGGALDPTPLVTHRLAFDRFPEAVELCRSHRALKVLLHPGTST